MKAPSTAVVTTAGAAVFAIWNPWVKPLYFAGLPAPLRGRPCRDPSRLRPLAPRHLTVRTKG